MAAPDQTSFSLLRPDDWHSHLRQGGISELVTRHASGTFGKVIAMPNLKPPITTVDQAEHYAQELRSFAGEAAYFQPLVPLYLTADLTREEIKKAVASPVVPSVKWYPEGVTTNSLSGIRDIRDCREQLEAMEEYGLIFSMHGETADETLDLMDREAHFLDHTFRWLMEHFPKLKMVYEHLSTEVLADFIQHEAPETVGATITPHHLCLTWEDDVERDGNFYPHNFCFPVVKHAEDRASLRALAVSDHPRVFAGTDSAPHPQSNKESPGARVGGIYNHAHALGFYAEVFDEEIDLSQTASQQIFERFMSRNGAKFYGYPESTDSITLVEEKELIPASYDYDEGVVVPMQGGGDVRWKAT